jgi:hypothetical protein
MPRSTPVDPVTPTATPGTFDVEAFAKSLTRKRGISARSKGEELVVDLLHSGPGEIDLSECRVPVRLQKVPSQFKVVTPESGSLIIDSTHERTGVATLEFSTLTTGVPPTIAFYENQYDIVGASDHSTFVAHSAIVLRAHLCVSVRLEGGSVECPPSDDEEGVRLRIDAIRGKILGKSTRATSLRLLGPGPVNVHPGFRCSELVVVATTHCGSGKITAATASFQDEAVVQLSGDSKLHIDEPQTAVRVSAPNRDGWVELNSTCPCGSMFDRASLTLGPDAEVRGASGVLSTLAMGHHSRLAGEPANPLVLEDCESIAETAVVEGVTIAEPVHGLKVLRALEHAQQVDVHLGNMESKKPAYATALRNQRAVEVGAKLANARCGNGNRRAEWSLQRLRCQRKLAATKTDRAFLTLVIAMGAATDVFRAAAIYFTAVVGATPLLIWASGENPLDVNMGHDGFVTFFRGVGLAVFGLLGSVPAAVGASSLPATAAWALPIKLVLALLVANLVTAVIRRARWEPAEV